MFEFIAIAALAVSGICAAVSSLWALSIYRAKRRKQATEPPKEANKEKPMKFEIEPMKEPMKFEIDIGTSDARASSPAPEDVRNHAIALAKAWSEMTVMTTDIGWGQNWKEAIEESLEVVEALSMAQEPLELDTPGTDYRQFIYRSRPEDIEEFFRSGRRQTSLT